jgi:hypothetical protein
MQRKEKKTVDIKGDDPYSRRTNKPGAPTDTQSYRMCYYLEIESDKHYD